MRPARKALFSLGIILLDIIVFNLSLLSSLLLVFFQNPQHETTIINIGFANYQLSDIGFFVCVNVSFFFIHYILRNDHAVCTEGHFSFQQVKNIFEIVAWNLLVLSILSYLFNIQIITTSLIWYFVSIFFILLLIQRIALKITVNLLQSFGYNNRSIVIVGINDRSLELVNYIQKNKFLGFRILGFIDDHNKNNKSANKYPVLCSLKEFKNFVRHNTIDEIAIFLPVKSQYDTIQEIISTCQEHGILVRYSSNIFNNIFPTPTKLSSVQIDNTFFMTIITGKIDGWATLAKRIIDIFVSLILLIVLLPLFLIVSIAIKISSSGPVFFIQERVGINKRRFDLFKFRTMVVDAENQISKLKTLNEVKGPVFKIKNDPRIISIGSFLRKSSIDELPQLFNVLLGDLSLVGPRPLPVRDFEGFYQDWHRRRFSVKPGITCTWQIKGRHDISFEDWMKLDLEYIDEWSLWLDFKILLGTIPAVLKFSKAS